MTKYACRPVFEGDAQAKVPNKSAAMGNKFGFVQEAQEHMHTIRAVFTF
jgi:hypothetical protein